MNQIREANKSDSDGIRQIYLDAFPDSEAGVIATLAIDLLKEVTNPKIIYLVATYDEEVVGHVAFSPVRVEDDIEWSGYILAPLAIKSDFQGRGIGSLLIEEGKRRLLAEGVDMLFVYGDPKYYGRFGFCADVAAKYLPPYTLAQPFGWQGIVFNECKVYKSNRSMSCVASLCKSELW